MSRAATSLLSIRWAEGKPEKIREFAEELVRLKVDVIHGAELHIHGVAKRATSTIPIVFMSHADPINTGHVKSLARPGGNATGLTIIMTETNVKGLEIFKEAIPELERALPSFSTGHSIAYSRVEGSGGCGPLTGAPHPTSARAQRSGVRRRLRGHGRGTCPSRSNTFNSALHGWGKAARRTSG